jgi:hypothetical protein
MSTLSNLRAPGKRIKTWVLSPGSWPKVCSEKLALCKVTQLSKRGLLDYGTSPYYAWPTPLADEPVIFEPNRDGSDMSSSGHQRCGRPCFMCEEAGFASTCGRCRIA